MINKQLINLSSPASGGGNIGEEGLILHLDANDVDSYDGDGSEWVDITDHEYKPTTNVSEHFNTVIWDGDSAATRDITGVGFKPDLVWIKNRNDSFFWHNLWDSVRGVGYGIFPNVANVQDFQSTRGYLSEFQDNGFELTRGSVDSGNNNETGKEVVAWCFKAGGAPSGSDKISIDGTSYADESAAELTAGNVAVTKLSANTKLGFSIATLDNVATSPSKTFSHGLGVPPELVIGKIYDGATDNWHVMAPLLGANNELFLNTQDDTQAWSGFNNTAPDSNHINLAWTTSTSYKMIFYSFASKRGVSKVGSYTGTGATNKVYTGFEPAFIIGKGSTGTASNWWIFDNKRGDGVLYPNLVNDEDLLSNYVSFDRDGFTLSDAAFVNQSGRTFVYYAVAKNTNEASLIPDTDLELHLDAGNADSTPTNWKDLSTNNYSTTFTNIDYDNELGNWYNFTGGSSEIEVGTSGQTAYITNNGVFTISMWVNITDNSGYQTLWANMNNGAGKRQIYARARPDNKLEVTAYPTGSNSSSYRQLISSSTVINDIYGKWSYLTFVMNGRQISSVYINGEPVIMSVTAGSSLLMNTAATDNIYVGGDANPGTVNSLNGAVGQFSAYSSALTQDQVRQNFNFTKSSYPNGFDGAINNSTFLPGTSGEVDAFDFNGSNSSVSLNSSAFSQNTYTIAAWFKLDALDLGGIFEWGDAASFERRGLIIWDGGSGNYKLYSSSYASNVPANTNLATNVWYHGAVTMDNGSASLYLNGQPDGTGTNTLASYTGTTAYVGRTQVGEYLDGKVSEVKVYNRVLTASEIETLYNEGNG